MLELHAAPWNPADFNTVQGRYPIPQHSYAHLRTSTFSQSNTTIAGSEGLGRVIHIVDNSQYESQSYTSPSNNSIISMGQWAYLGLPGMGSFRSHMWLPEQALLPLSNTLTNNNSSSIAQWATLLQLGGTAYNLLIQYIRRKHHDDDNDNNDNTPRPITIVQNAAHSNVGFIIQQIVPLLFPNSTLINVVRTPCEPYFAQFPQHTTNDTTHHHYNLQVAESELMNAKNVWNVVRDEAASCFPHAAEPHPWTPPILALDAVGGDSAASLWKLLGQGGTMVTYGALSQSPISNISCPSLIFQDKHLQGHWHSQWMERADRASKQRMLQQLVEWVESGRLQLPPVQVVPLKDFCQDVLRNHGGDTNNEKHPIITGGQSNTGDAEDKDDDSTRALLSIPGPSRPKIVVDLTEHS